MPSLRRLPLLLFIVVLTSNFWRKGENPALTDESVLTSNSAGRMLDLPDGSQVEMRAQSQLRIDHADDGLRIRLLAGSVIVTAAKQGSGHLYVVTSDAMVSVVGTVFVVTAERTGSHVGVIEGVVSVGGAAISQKLFQGQQVSTNPAIGQVPLEVQVTWSRNAAIYLAMLAKLQPSVAPAQPPVAAATAAGPQSQPAAENRQEPRSLLILGSANYGAPGQRAAFGNNRLGGRLILGGAPNNGGRSLFATTPEAERAMEQALVSRELYAVDIQLSDETARELPTRQIAFDVVFTLLPGPYSIKFLPHDRITDRMGTYRTDVVIPNLNKETNLPISSVVLSDEFISLGHALSGSCNPPQWTRSLSTERC